MGPQQQWYLEINTESYAWSGCHQESAVAPHLQTAPPGYKKKTESECQQLAVLPGSSLVAADLGALLAPLRSPLNTGTFTFQLNFLPFL